MLFKAETITVIVPDIGDNLKQPKDKQLRVHIRRPNAEEISNLYEINFINNTSVDEIKKNKNDKDKDKKKKKQVMSIVNQTGTILRNHVIKIENMEVEVDGKIKQITTGHDLAECNAFGIKKLVDDICAEVMDDKVDEDKLKNSQPPLG